MKIWVIYGLNIWEIHGKYMGNLDDMGVSINGGTPSSLDGDNPTVRNG